MASMPKVNKPAKAGKAPTYGKKAPTPKPKPKTQWPQK